MKHLSPKLQIRQQGQNMKILQHKIIVGVTLFVLIGTMAYAQTHSLLKRFDKDGDKQISKAEAPQKMKQRFSKHDLDKNGFISGEELNTLPKRPQKKTQRKINNN